MTKYYYDDPLEALWMHDKLGVEFENADVELRAVTGNKLIKIEYLEQWGGHKVTRDFMKLLLHERDCGSSYGGFIAHEGESFVEKYYARLVVKPESMHIFEPMDGDVVTCCGSICTVSGAAAPLNYQLHPIASSKYSDPYDKTAQIIQRNGIPFMWPKEEVK